MRLMKSVARRVALNLSEAKRFTILNELITLPPMVDGESRQWVFRNIMSVIPQAAQDGLNPNTTGASSFARIGSEIVDPLMKFKGTWTIHWDDLAFNHPTAYGTVYLTVYVISTNDQFGTPGVFQNYPTGSGNPTWFLQPDGTRVTLNGNNVRVIKKWHRKVTPDQLYNVTPALIGAEPVVSSTTTRGRQSVDCVIRWRKRGKVTYEDDPINAWTIDGNLVSSYYIKGNQYYILAGWETMGGVVNANKPNLAGDTYMYFKDP